MALYKNAQVPAISGSTTFSLLNFANDASSSIQEAFSKPNKKRKVNIRKYIQKRVKRLNDTPASSKSVRGANAQTKSKLASNKPLQRRSPPIQPPLTSHSQSLPVLNRPIVSTSVNSTNSYNSQSFSYSDSNLYQQHVSQPVGNPDSSLDDILTVLTDLESTTPLARHCSSNSVDTTSYIAPQSNLESQVLLAEYPLMDHPYSPYSDCSDELFTDTPYSSPCSGGSYNCSPVPPTQAVGTGCEWTPANSPPMPSTQFPITSSCNWMPSCVPVTTAAGFDYLPYHQSPPSSCDQILVSPSIWECINFNYPENF